VAALHVHDAVIDIVIGIPSGTVRAEINRGAPSSAYPLIEVDGHLASAKTVGSCGGEVAINLKLHVCRQRDRTSREPVGHASTAALADRCAGLAYRDRAGSRKSNQQHAALSYGPIMCLAQTCKY